MNRGTESSGEEELAVGWSGRSWKEEDLGSWLQDQQHFSVWVCGWERGTIWAETWRELWVASQGAVSVVTDLGSGAESSCLGADREEIRGEAWGMERVLSVLHEIAEGPPCPMLPRGLLRVPLCPCAPGDCWGSSVTHVLHGGLLRVLHIRAHEDCWESSVSHMLLGIAEGPLVPHAAGVTEGPPCPTCSRRLQRRFTTSIAPLGLPGSSMFTCSGDCRGSSTSHVLHEIPEGPPYPTCSTQWRAWSLMNVGGIWQKLGSRVTSWGLCVGGRAVALACSRTVRARGGRYGCTAFKRCLGLGRHQIWKVGRGRGNAQMLSKENCVISINRKRQVGFPV